MNVSTTKKGVQHIASRFKKHGAGSGREQRSVMNIRFGYRSLIDWSRSPAWTYGMGEAASVGGLTDQQRAANPTELTAPGSKPNVNYEAIQKMEKVSRTSTGGYRFSNEFENITTATSAGISSIPETWMGQGPPARPGSSNRLGGSGSIGAAWNVANPNVPPLTGINNVRRAFGHHVPQWLYRLAEIAQGTGMNLSMFQNAEKFMRNEDEGMREMGRSMSKGLLDESSHISMKRKRGLPDELESGSAEGFEYDEEKGLYGGSHENPQEGGFGRGSWSGPFGSAGPWHQAQQTAWRVLPQLKDKYKNYTSTFSRNVYSGLSQSIPTQMRYFRQALLRKASSAEAQQEIDRIMKGVPFEVNESGYGNSAIGDTGGQTHQEKMAEIGGLGESPSAATLTTAGPSGAETSMVSPLGQWGGSNPVDVHFHEGQKSSPKFFRADLTTQSYQKGAHHGIGLTSINSPIKYNENQLKKARKDIVTDQERQREQWNSIIRVLKEQLYGGGTGSSRRVRGSNLSPVEMRRKIAAETIGASRSGGYAYREVEQIRAVSELSRSRAEIIQILENELGAVRGDHLDHVLHSLGTFIAGDAGTWANVMPIDMIYPPTQDVMPGTLTITYDFDGEGYFNEITLRDVHIQEGSVEKWLYDNRNTNIAIASEQQLKDMANESMAVEGYVNISGMGTLMAAVDTGSSRVYEQAHMAMPIPGALAGIIDAVSMQAILSVGKGLEQDLSSQVVNEAVRFSTQMRNPSQMSNIPDWINVFASAFLNVPSTVADVTAAQGGDDPFWYLWAAPYISTNYPALGGGGQQHTG